VRVWFLRLRTALAALAAVFLLWELPAVLEMMSAPRQGLGGNVKPAVVLRVWLCEDWTGMGMRWLTGRAAAFEKANPGVRVVLRRAQRGDWQVKDCVPPDVLLFDTQTMGDPTGVLTPLSGAYDLRPAVRAAGTWRGVPYAVALCYGAPVRILNEEKPQGAEIVMSSEAEYQEFVQQKAGTLIATVREVRRLLALEAAGKGFPFRAEPYGDTAELLLMAGRFAAEGERARLSEAFIQFLLSQESQNALPEMGLLPASACARLPEEEKYPLLFAMEKETVRAVNAFDERPNHGVQ